MRRTAAVLVALLLALGALGASPALASATTPAGGSMGSGPGSAGLICSTTGGSPSASQAQGGPWLPIDRWAGVAGADLHTRLSGGFLGISDLGQEANRELQSLSLSLGNTLWQAGTDLVGLSGRFCFAGQVGVAIDHGAAAIGNAVTSSGILVAVVVAAIVALLWRRSRHGTSLWGPLLRTAVVLGVLTAMLAGASGTRLVGGVADFGTFSPGWLVNEVYGTISSLASAPTALISAQPTGLAGLSSQGPASCGAYTASLVGNYKASYGASPVAQTAASLPVALNYMWEQAGLRTYTEVQFGAANPYGAWAYCHQLDYDAGYSPASQAKVAGQSLPRSTTVYPQALAWPAPGSSNPTVDASIIGWAACEGYPGHWAIPPAWASAGVTAQACDQWWQSSGVPSSLNWGPSTQAVAQAASQATASGADGAALSDFLLNYHGEANGTADAAAITYAASSLVVFAVFALLAGAVLVAKVALLVVMLLLAAVALLSAWPGQGRDRLGQVARYALGLIVFATGAQLLLALVALVTGLVSEMVSALAGQGSFLDVLAMGFAPVGAVYILHFVFTKVLKAPSPFKLSGALAWAASAGAVGAGAARAVDRHVDQRGIALVRSAKTAVLARYGAPRADRLGAMRPAGEPGGQSPSATGTPASRPGASRLASAAKGVAGLAAAASAAGAAGKGGAAGALAAGAAGKAGGTAAAGATTGATNGATATPLDGKNPHASALGRLGAQARWGTARQSADDAKPARPTGNATGPRAQQPSTTPERPGYAPGLDGGRPAVARPSGPSPESHMPPAWPTEGPTRTSPARSTGPASVPSSTGLGSEASGPVAGRPAGSATNQQAMSPSGSNPLPGAAPPAEGPVTANPLPGAPLPAEGPVTANPLPGAPLPVTGAYSAGRRAGDYVSSAAPEGDHPSHVLHGPQHRPSAPGTMGAAGEAPGPDGRAETPALTALDEASQAGHDGARSPADDEPQPVPETTEAPEATAVEGASTREQAPGQVAGASTREQAPGQVAGASTREQAPGQVAGASTREQAPGQVAGAALASAPLVAQEVARGDHPAAATTRPIIPTATGHRQAQAPPADAAPNPTSRETGLDQGGSRHPGRNAPGEPMPGAMAPSRPPQGTDEGPRAGTRAHSQAGQPAQGHQAGGEPSATSTARPREEPTAHQDVPRPTATATGRPSAQAAPTTPAAAATWVSWRRLAAERRETARAERKAVRKGGALLRAESGGWAGTARSAVDDRAHLAWQRLRDRPARTILRGSAIAAGAVAAGVVATASTPFAVGAAALYAGHRALRWRAEAPARQSERAARRQAALAAYRAQVPNRDAGPSPKG